MIQDGLRNPFTRQADVRGGDRGRRRARDDPRRPRPLGAALARARDRGDRRGPPARGDRRRSRSRAKKGDTVVEVDEAPRRDTTLEALAKLPPLIGKDGSHTAGNSPGVNDGAGALVLACDEWAAAQRQGGARPTIVAQAAGRRRLRLPRPHAGQRGQEGAREGGPAADDIDLWEINEAFASVDAELDPRCSASTRTGSTSTAARSRSATRSAPPGARILGTLVHELRRRGGGYGCAAICSGGGQGDADRASRSVGNGS